MSSKALPWQACTSREGSLLAFWGNLHNFLQVEAETSAYFIFSSLTTSPNWRSLDLAARKRIGSLRVTCWWVLWHWLVPTDHFLKVVLGGNGRFWCFVHICPHFWTLSPVRFIDLQNVGWGTWLCLLFSLSTFPPKSGLGNLTMFTHLPSSLSVLAHSNYSLVVQTLGVVGWREHILDLVFEVLIKARSWSWSPSCWSVWEWADGTWWQQ